MKDFNEIIEEICNEENIKLSIYQDNWLKILEKDNKIKYIVGHKFSLNNQGISIIMDDKELFYELMMDKNLPIITYHYIGKDYNRDYILSLFNKYNRKVVIKGNIGQCGNMVYKVVDETRLFKVIDKLLEVQYSISLCPYYDVVNEYRVIVLNNEIKLIYGKENAKVIGDGIHSLQELALSFNKDYFTKHPTEDYIPKLNEKVILDFRFNLSKGAKVIEEIPSELKEELSNIALKVSSCVDLSFASIDIIKTIDNKLLIMEANSGIMMSNYLKQTNNRNLVKRIYKEAVEAMFKE